jgi:hypothetical protein
VRFTFVIRSDGIQFRKKEAANGGQVPTEDEARGMGVVEFANGIGTGSMASQSQHGSACGSLGAVSEHIKPIHPSQFGRLEAGST